MHVDSFDIVEHGEIIHQHGATTSNVRATVSERLISTYDVANLNTSVAQIEAITALVDATAGMTRLTTPCVKRKLMPVML